LSLASRSTCLSKDV